MSALIGLDIGTTACKASLFREDGTLVAKATREYSIQIPHKGWAEQNAEIVWTLAEEALAQVLKDSGTRDVVAIGISAQGEAVMPVNAQGQTLRPAILGMDTRTDAQNVWLRERFGAEHLFDLTGVPVHTINTMAAAAPPRSRARRATLGSAWRAFPNSDPRSRAHRSSVMVQLLRRSSVVRAAPSPCRSWRSTQTVSRNMMSCNG